MNKLQRYSTCNYSEFDTSSKGEWVKYEDVAEREKLLEICEEIIERTKKECGDYREKLSDAQKVISRLEALVENMKCCGNCQHQSITCRPSLWNYCVNKNKWGLRT